MVETVADGLARALKAAFDLEAPISVRLAQYAATQKQLAGPYFDAVDRLVARLKGVSAGEHAPQIGDPMPEFILPDANGRLTRLDELLINGPLVIAFHRGHWCPFCRINAHALSEIYESVTAIGGQIVAITPERGQFATQHRSDAGAKYLMLSDIEASYALSLNLAIWIDDDVRAHLLGFGRDLNVYLGSKGWILPIPATFIVGTDGVIVERFVDPDHRHRMEPDAIVAALARAT